MIVDLNSLASIRERHENEKIILTSGTFDLFHTGHLAYLQGVKSYGDIVVVMLSGDARVRARKGPTRPIIPEDQRAQILNALKVVDYVFLDPSKLSPKETDPIYAEILARLHFDMYVTDGPDPRFWELLQPLQRAVLPRSDVTTSTTDILERIVSSIGEEHA